MTQVMEHIHWPWFFFCGFAATFILTTSLAICRGQGWTRMDMSLLLGTALTYNRERAKLYGFLIHFAIGWVFSFVYIFIFLQTGYSPVWLGPLLGLIHALSLLSVGMWILPAFHPRMAHEEYGPDPTHQLEPPGYFALNYGRSTPVAILLAHVLYGCLLGILYH